MLFASHQNDGFAVGTSSNGQRREIRRLYPGQGTVVHSESITAPRVTALAADAEHVYWIAAMGPDDATALLRRPWNRGAEASVSQVCAAKGAKLEQLVVTDGRVYFWRKEPAGAFLYSLPKSDLSK